MEKKFGNGISEKIDFHDGDILPEKQAKKPDSADVSSLTGEGIIFSKDGTARNKHEEEIWNDRRTAYLFTGQGVTASEIIKYYLSLESQDYGRTNKLLSSLQEALSKINPQAKFNTLDILDNENSGMWQRTDFVQPLIYTLSILTFEMMKHKRPDYMAGHSIGALSALTAAGALPFEKGILTIAARGKFMQEEAMKADNGMCAVIGLVEEKVREICKKTGMEIVLINAPAAFVVGGARADFSKVEEMAVQMGARKTIILPTSGAFHSRYMIGAYKKFKEFMKNVDFREPRVPVAANMEGNASSDPSILKRDIIESMVNPVNWERLMEFLKSKSVKSFVEVGPGTFLTSLCRMNGIDRDQVSHA